MNKMWKCKLLSAILAMAMILSSCGTVHQSDQYVEDEEVSLSQHNDNEEDSKVNESKEEVKEPTKEEVKDKKEQVKEQVKEEKPVKHQQQKIVQKKIYTPQQPKVDNSQPAKPIEPASVTPAEDKKPVEEKKDTSSYTYKRHKRHHHHHHSGGSSVVTIADVVANPNSGEVDKNSTVTLTCATDGAKIYYTIDKSEPTASSTEYTKPVEITEDMDIKAVAIKDGKSGAVKVFNYTVKTSTKPVTIADVVANPNGGEVDKNSTVTLTCATDGAKIYYTTNGDAPTASSTEYTKPVEITADMDIKAVAIKDGKSGAVKVFNYTVKTSTKPVTIADVVANPNGGEVDKNSTVTLTCATDGAKIYYTIDKSEPTASSTEYTKPVEITANMTIKAVAIKDGKSGAVKVFNYTVKDKEPTEKPLTVAEFSNKKFNIGDSFYITGIVTAFENKDLTKVTIKDSQEGEKLIRFSRKSTYIKNLSQTDKDKLKNLKIGDRITLRANYRDSKTYRIDYNSITDLVVESQSTKVNDVTSNFTTGATIERGSKIELSCATDGAKIYYTTNGDAPTASSTPYTDAIEITADTTIKAIAILDDGKESEIATFTYMFVEKIDVSTIKDVRNQINKIAKIQGVVTFVKPSSTKVNDKYIKYNAVYIQDDTAGIMVYCTENATYNIGDKLEVLGTIGSEYDMSKITPSNDITVLSSNNSVTEKSLTFEQIKGHEEDYECQFIKVENVTASNTMDTHNNTTIIDNDGKEINLTSDSIIKNRKYDSIKGVFVYSYGTYKLIPRDINDFVVSSDPSSATTEHPNNDIIKNDNNAINVYFNKEAQTQFAFDGNKANNCINLETRLLNRINSAKNTIDVATYEINLPDVITALMDKAADGKTVRVIADAKKITDDTKYQQRYVEMVANLEKMRRGNDNKINTDDDIYIMSDGPIYPVKDADLRSKYKLPIDYSDLMDNEDSQKDYFVFDTTKLVCEGEKNGGSYRTGNEQMHNKFVIVDGEWVWTGSWNFTKTGLYGDEKNMNDKVLGGNTQNSIEIHSSDFANIYTTEFNEMYGTDQAQPNAENAKFHQRKTDNTVHKLKVGDTDIEVYFSPGDKAIEKMTNYITDSADHRVYFDIFSWSASTKSPAKDVLDALKTKLENDNSFEVKGSIDRSFYSQNWAPPKISESWTTKKPTFYKANEDAKLHSKTMIIDANTDSDPTVIIGSTNWSDNGENINDENMLFIHNEKIANQFLQDFYGVVKRAGKNIPAEEKMILDNITFTETKIHDIQGNTHSSPMQNKGVAIEGIVTGTVPKYKYLIIQEEDTDKDTDDSTSEGIYVDAYGTADAQNIITGLNLGDTVKIKGIVKEKPDYYDNKAKKDQKPETDLYMTSLDASEIEVVKKGSESDLPDPIKVGEGFTNLKTNVAYSEKVDDLTTSTNVLDPNKNALDFFESMECMRIQIQKPKIIGFEEKYGEVTVVPDEGKSIPKDRLTLKGGVKGGGDYYFFNKFTLCDTMYKTKSYNPKIGNILNNVDGVLIYDFGNYKLLHYGEDKLVPTTQVTPEREKTNLVATDNDLTIASYNIENFGGDASSSKVNAVGKSIVENLKNPDIIGLIEVQDNDGQTGSNSSAADKTCEKLISGIVSNGGIEYDYVQIDPEYNKDGGAPGGNIRVAYLYNPDRVQVANSKTGEAGDAKTEAQVVTFDDGTVGLEKNPARLGTQADCFASTRRSLVTDFMFRGEHVFIINNHFSSKRGDTGEYGRTFPCTKGSEPKRHEQANIVNGFVKDLIAKNNDAKVVLLGDMNDFENSETINLLKKDANLLNLHDYLDLNERYSYVYQGISQTLDNFLISEPLQNSDKNSKDKVEFDIVHFNSEFSFKDGRASDHDALIALFKNVGKDNYSQVKSTIAQTPSGKIDKGTQVTFTCDDGGIIYYTTDGSDPVVGGDKTTNTNTNTLTLTVNEKICIKTLVVKDSQNSAIKEYNYTLNTGLMTIEEAKKLTTEEFMVEGVVSHDLKAYGGGDIYFQDATGGYLIHLDYKDKTILDENIKNGSKIQVTGINSAYKGKAQLKATKQNIVFISDETLLEPQIVAIKDLGKIYDSKLVKIENVVIKEITTDKYNNTTIKFENTDFDAKVDARSGDNFADFKLKVGDSIDIVGVLDVNDFGQRIKARSFDDVVISQTNTVEPTITSVTPVDVEVVQNETPNMPVEVTANLSDGKTKEVTVSWTMDEFDNAILGEQTVSGTIDEYEGEVIATINVVEAQPQPAPQPINNEVLLKSEEPKTEVEVSEDNTVITDENVVAEDKTSEEPKTEVEVSEDNTLISDENVVAEDKTSEESKTEVEVSEDNTVITDENVVAEDKTSEEAKTEGTVDTEEKENVSLEVVENKDNNEKTSDDTTNKEILKEAI